MSLQLVSLLVADHDEAIAFFVDRLGFDLVEDSPAISSRTGEPKRWVVVRPPDGGCGVLLARAADDAERERIGAQTGERVAFFWRVGDVAATYERLRSRGVEFTGPVRHEAYGDVVVFRDVSGNRWDLLGPARAGSDPQQ